MEELGWKRAFEEFFQDIVAELSRILSEISQEELSPVLVDLETHAREAGRDLEQIKQHAARSYENNAFYLQPIHRYLKLVADKAE